MPAPPAPPESGRRPYDNAEARLRTRYSLCVRHHSVFRRHYLGVGVMGLESFCRELCSRNCSSCLVNSSARGRYWAREYSTGYVVVSSDGQEGPQETVHSSHSVRLPMSERRNVASYGRVLGSNVGHRCHALFGIWFCHRTARQRAAKCDTPIIKGVLSGIIPAYDRSVQSRVRQEERVS